MDINKDTDFVSDVLNLGPVKTYLKTQINSLRLFLTNSKINKFFHNTRFLIIIFVYFFIVSTASLVCFFSIVQSDRALIDIANDRLIKTVQAEARQEEQVLLKAERPLHGLAEFIKFTFDLSQIDNLDYVKNYTNNVMIPATRHFYHSINYIEGMYSYLDVMRINPKKYVAEAWFTEHPVGEIDTSSPEEYTINDPTMSWYYQVAEAQKPEWIEQYYDKDLKKTIISYAVPIYKDNNNKSKTFIGVAGIDMTSDDLKRSVNKIKVFKTGYAFLVTQKHYFIASRDYSIDDSLFEVDDGYYSPLQAELKKRNSGLVKLDKNIIAFSKLYNGYVLFVTVPEKEILAPIFNLNVLLILFTAIAVLIATAIMFALLKHLNKLVDSLVMSDNIIMTIANSIEAKDVCTKGHVQRVTAYALKVGEYLNLSATELTELKTASMLHDIGKIAIPDEVLNKPGKLTNEEFEIMKSHTIFGAKILQPLNSFQNLVGMVRHHHERLDGSGYPDGLKGDEIDVSTRILTIIDIYDALLTERPYKKPFSKETALKILDEEAEKGYLDKDVLEAFKFILKNYRTVGELNTFQLVKI